VTLELTVPRRLRLLRAPALCPGEITDAPPVSGPRRARGFLKVGSAMKKIQLTRGYEALVDDVYFDWLSQWKWRVTFSSSGKPYAITDMRDVNGRKHCFGMHSLVIFGGNEVDHKNGDGLDNRRENLRDCTHNQNMKNKCLLRYNTSGTAGVSWIASIKKWKVQLQVDGVYKYLGIYESKQEAIQVRLLASKREFGEFSPH